MSVSSIFYDLVIFSMFYLVGFVLREKVSFLRKLYLPTAVIGGVVALLGGPQVIGLWEIPASFGSYATPLLAIVCTASCLGVTINLSRVKTYGDFFCGYNGLRFAELGIGALVGMVCCILIPQLPVGWGLLGVATFHGGHGDGALYGTALDEVAGITDYTSLAMVMATVGILVAILVGAVIANIGIRRGWPQFMKAGDKRVDSNRRAYLDEDERTPIGMQILHGGSASALAFQFALLCMAIFVGKWIFYLVGLVIPAFGDASNYILNGIIGAFIVTPLLKMAKLDKYIEPETNETLSSFCIEIVVLCSVASLNLSTVAAYWLGIVIMAITITLVCVLNIWYHKQVSGEQWFEKGLYSFGAGTGTQATGMALLRMIDPTWRNNVMEANAVQGGVMNVAIAWWPVVLPMLAINSTWVVGAIGIGGAVVLYGVGWILFHKKVKAKAE